METVKIIFVAFLAIALGSNSNAQTSIQSKIFTTITEPMEVSGKCDLCKLRIEKAAKLDGVSNVQWSPKTKVLMVAFDPTKTNTDQIGNIMVYVGYDNVSCKADDEAYNGLDDCCKYR